MLFGLFSNHNGEHDRQVQNNEQINIQNDFFLHHSTFKLRGRYNKDQILIVHFTISLNKKGLWSLFHEQMDIKWMV